MIDGGLAGIDEISLSVGLIYQLLLTSGWAMCPDNRRFSLYSLSSLHAILGCCAVYLDTFAGSSGACNFRVNTAFSYCI